MMIKLPRTAAMTLLVAGREALKKKAGGRYSQSTKNTLNNIFFS